jgi:mannose-6-phosphate isomerase
VPTWDEPLAFQPIFVPRVWGGQRLREHFGKALPEDEPIGESWEVVDRDDAQSTLDGELTLGELWAEHRRDVFGERGARSESERYPLLIKLLDARESLSVQVHPPAHRAAALGGEPKSEAWLFLDADPGAFVYAGLAEGVTAEGFAEALQSGDEVTRMLHRLDVEPDTALYLPSGRVHAIGPGCLIAEVQQSSDTTYRVWDYGRPGLDGRPRELHVEESLACLDWDDVEPGLLRHEDSRRIHTPYFELERLEIGHDRLPAFPEGEGGVLGVLRGEVSCAARTFSAGDFFVAPAAGRLDLASATGADVLRVMLPGD